MAPQSASPIEVFYSYSHKDEELRDELKKHLASLKRQGIITDWYDRDISAGTQWDDEIKSHLDSASVILLLISPDFMDSDYINDVEVTRAMERHDAGEACVIPVFLRPINWKGAPFGKLQGLPMDTKPVSSWHDRDEAFVIVSEGIQRAIETLKANKRKIEEKPSVSSQIPRTAVEFVARRDKNGHDILAQLKEKLAPQNHQLIVLWGQGGVGKTRLANEAAQELKEAFANRIAWVSADGLPDFSLSTLLYGIAAQLEGAEYSAELRPLPPELKKEKVSALIAAVPTLIVLDNFETIAPPEQKLCVSFLAQDASCPALITTRTKFPINLADNISIDAMSPNEAESFLDNLIASAPDAEAFTETNRHRIIQTSTAIPLVMQWVVEQIILSEDPEAVLDKLSQGKGDAAERVFDNSFNLPQVGDDGRAALLALSLFTPSAARPSLLKVVGFDGDEERLSKATISLGALRLVRTAEGGKRLRIEGLTRELAKARLAKDQRHDEFRQRFVTHFMNYAKAHRQVTPEDFEALEAERDNVLSAMDVAFELEDWATVVSTRFALEECLDLHGYWDEAIRSGKQALAAARSLQRESSIAGLAHNLAITHQQRGELDSAKELYNESLEIEKKLGNQSDIAITLHELGRLAQAQGEIEEARRLYNESLEITKKLGNQSGIAVTLGQLGLLAEEEGNRKEAVRLLREALSIFEKLKSPNAEVARESLKRLGAEET